MPGRFLVLTPLLVLAACNDEPVSNGYGSTTPRIERPAAYGSTLEETVTPVRIGELGANFAACNAQGELRARTTTGPIPVRAAPFEQAQRTGQLAPGSSFFICSRSHDQQWLGVVYDGSGRASPSCEVSAPVTGVRDYEGLCDSGWVASAQVRLISGVEPPSGEASANDAQPK